LSTAAVVAGAITGPRLPGADADPVVDWRDVGEDDPTRVVVSPLVDIQTRLIDQADVELFSVRSPRAGYWRLTALDEFDGRIWRSSYGTDDADGQLPRAVESQAPAETVTQTVSVSALAAVWLPAAFEPAAIDAGATEVGWDEASSTLLVERDVANSDGLTYEVRSAIPQWAAAELRTASADVPDDIADRYLQLPSDLDPAVEALARDVTAGATTPYDQALALQDYLRTFTYDLDVPPSNANDALTAFLFDTRRGYCQQFAGSFAALARSIGIPTRIAVGFTPGIQDRDDPTLFRVRGEHAHAWDEIYLDRFGWVIVDPTPGRAPPRAEDWLGVPEQQDAPGGDGTLATTPPADGTDPGDGLASDPAGGVRNPDANLEGLSTAAGPTAGRDGAGLAPFVWRAVLTIGVAVAGYLVVVPTALGLQGLRRRRRASTPAAKVRLAWTNVVHGATAVGVRLPASLTVAEIADRLATVVPGAAGAVRTVARHMDKVAYAELAPTPGDVAAAGRAGTVIQGALRARLSLGQRIARHFDVRRLRSPHRRRARLRIEPARAGLRE
jgi:transglutaminase-like putative cysteine protease